MFVYLSLMSLVCAVLSGHSKENCQCVCETLLASGPPLIGVPIDFRVLPCSLGIVFIHFVVLMGAEIETRNISLSMRTERSNGVVDV